MPTIRDLTSAIRRRPGVDAVLFSGRDGLLVDGSGAESLDLHDIAARIPSLISDASALGDAAHVGECGTDIIEFAAGYAIISPLPGDTLLTVIASREADLGKLLFDIRSHRSQMGSLV